MIHVDVLMPPGEDCDPPVPMWPGTSSWQRIDPERAQRLLQTLGPMPKRNRKRVDLYATRMLRGEWKDYHPEPLILNAAGELLDGQHRLCAIVQSGQSYSMLLVQYHDRVYTEGLAETLNRGRTRTTDDVLTIGLGTLVDRRLSAIARSMYWGLRFQHQPIPDPEFVAFYRQHMQVIRETSQLFSRRVKSLGTASHMAACARARYALPFHTVAQFVKVLQTGQSLTQAELTIITFREWCLKQPVLHGGTMAHEVYARASYALRAYADGRRMKFCMKADKELFPLPEDPP